MHALFLTVGIKTGAAIIYMSYLCFRGTFRCFSSKLLIKRISSWVCKNNCLLSLGGHSFPSFPFRFLWNYFIVICMKFPPSVSIYRAELEVFIVKSKPVLCAWALLLCLGQKNAGGILLELIGARSSKYHFPPSWLLLCRHKDGQHLLNLPLRV